jgi:hypothetical protein
MEPAIFQFASLTSDHQESRVVARLDGLLRDQLFGKLIVKE